MSKPMPNPMPPSEDDVLRRMLTSPPALHKSKPAPKKRKPKPTK